MGWDAERRGIVIGIRDEESHYFLDLLVVLLEREDSSGLEEVVISCLPPLLPVTQTAS